MRTFLLLFIGLMAGSSFAAERSSFCSNTVQDVFPDQHFSCEGLQSLKRGHDGHALEMFQQAARWGDKRAQYRVGLMHLGGIGTTPDTVEGAAWLLLANERNNRTISERLSQAHQQMDASQWEAAHVRATELQQHYGDFSALERRDRWARERKRDLTGSRLGKPMATVEVQHPGIPSQLTGITGRQMLARLDRYVDTLQDVMTTIEYRDFEVIETGHD